MTLHNCRVHETVLAPIDRKLVTHPSGMREIIFEVTEAPEGGYDARALGHSVFTQGDDWNDLREMVRDAVLCHFDDRETPRVIRLHFVREEAIAV